MKVISKKKYLIDLLNNCKEKLFKDAELYYYHLRMIEFIETLDFNKNIILYHNNKFIHALCMKYFTSYFWRIKRYHNLEKKNDQRKKHEKTNLQLSINFIDI